MKKLLSCLMSLVMLFGVFEVTLPAYAYVAYDGYVQHEITATAGSFEHMNWHYDTDTKTLYVECDGKLDEQYRADYTYRCIHENQNDYYYDEMPLELNGYPWNIHNIDAFAEHLVLSGNLTVIGADAFRSFVELKEIRIPDTVTKIDDHAFYACKKAQTLTLSASLTSIGDECFSSCRALGEVTLPETLVRIGDGAFGYCPDLRISKLPDGLKYIGVNIFSIDNGSSCHVSDELVKENGCYYWGKYLLCADDRYQEEITVREGTEVIADGAFGRLLTKDYDDIRESFVLPESVRIIGKSVFQYAKFHTVVLPQHLESIGESCFENSSIESISLPDTLTELPAQAFFGVSGLTGITLPSSIKEIGNECFVWTGLTKITLPGSLKTIGNECFAHTGLTSVTLPRSLKTIGEHPFETKDFKKYKISKKNRYFKVKDGILYNKNMTVLVDYPVAKEGTVFRIPDGIKTVKADFSGRKVRAYGLPKSVKTLYYEVDRCLKIKIYYNGTEEEYKKITHLNKSGKMRGNGYRYYCTAKLSRKKYTFDGKTHLPKITVYSAMKKPLKEGRDYTVTLPKGRKKVGKYTVKIKLKGKYKGTIRLTYQIAPRPTAITSVKAIPAGFRVKWKKRSDISGYQLVYTAYKGVTDGYSGVILKNNRSTYTFKNISELRTYTVFIRTYKTVKGKKIYSRWSKGVKVKVTELFETV